MVRTVLAFLLATSAALAVDIPVAPGGSIQAAIAVALAGDRVVVAPGTYVEQIDFLGKQIEVIGLQGAALTIIDGNLSAPVVSL